MFVFFICKVEANSQTLNYKTVQNTYGINVTTQLIFFEKTVWADESELRTDSVRGKITFIDSVANKWIVFNYYIPKRYLINGKSQRIYSNAGDILRDGIWELSTKQEYQPQSNSYINIQDTAIDYNYISSLTEKITGKELLQFCETTPIYIGQGNFLDISDDGNILRYDNLYVDLRNMIEYNFELEGCCNTNTIFVKLPVKDSLGYLYMKEEKWIRDSKKQQSKVITDSLFSIKKIIDTIIPENCGKKSIWYVDNDDNYWYASGKERFQYDDAKIKHISRKMIPFEGYFITKIEKDESFEYVLYSSRFKDGKILEMKDDVLFGNNYLEVSLPGPDCRHITISHVEFYTGIESIENSQRNQGNLYLLNLLNGNILSIPADIHVDQETLNFYDCNTEEYNYLLFKDEKNRFYKYDSKKNKLIKCKLKKC
jgi:hypothetical protein